MKFPRGVNGQRLIDHLCRNWDYVKVTQVGSHVILVSESPMHHRLPIPLHSPLGIGICKRIVREVCEAKNVSQDRVLRGL
jgi:predicted RNA binding protein YcfA (HicA-like mRNA interferase family)